MAGLLAAATPASGAIVINEVESDGATDFVELFNTEPDTAAAAVNIGNYEIDDDNDGNRFQVPPGTMIPPGGFYLAGNNPVGLSGSDAVKLYAAGDLATPIDTYTWTAHAVTTYGRCPDGTGVFTWTNSPTPDAANACPGPALTWPGSSDVALGDGVTALGSNISGLAYQGSGSGTPGVLWAVKNDPGTLFRLIHDGTKWTPDTANGWGAGKGLRYGDGLGNPDAEGVTLASGDSNGVYVATERDGNGASRPAVLRYDVSSAAATLNATRDWNLTPGLPGLGGNGGLEAVTWIPDDVLVAKGFLDEVTAAAYNPASYADHGSGLFFVGVEQDGRIIAYALDQAADTFTKVATIQSGFPAVMALEYEAEKKLLWAACDNECDGRHATLDVAQVGANDGQFVVTNTYERPAGMANLNNEGFAIAPQAECVNSLKPVIWSDDSNTGGNALRAGTLNCAVPATQPTPTPTPTTTPVPGPGPTTTPTPPAAPRDLDAPSLKIALKLTKSGRFAVRRTGRFGLVITLGERANLTIAATARKSARSRARSIFRQSRTGVAAGKRTLTLSLTRRIRRALRRGETVTLTVVARDAALNATTRRAKAKVR